MIIKAQDLQVGDEFLTPSNGSLRWFKLVRPLKLKKSSKRVVTGYSAARCSTKCTIVTINGWNGKPFNKTTYHCTGDEHNVEVYVNVNYKDMWLVARNGQKI